MSKLTSQERELLSKLFSSPQDASGAIRLLFSVYSSPVGLLRRMLDQDTAEEKIPQISAQNIIALFDNKEFLTYLAVQRRIFKKEHGGLYDFPLTKFFLDYAETGELSPAETRILKDKMAAIEPQHKRFIAMRDQMVWPNFLLSWKEGKFWFREPPFTEPGDVDAFFAFITENLKNYFRIDPEHETVKPAIDSLRQRLEMTARGKAKIEVVKNKLGKSPKAAWAPWKPDIKDTLIIFDSSTLDHLAVPRAVQERTWLDLLSHTASLPHIKIIIPSVIADFEMQGIIPVRQDANAHTGFEPVDMRFFDNRHRLAHIQEPMGKLLAGASRARINTDGTVETEMGENPNIIVMETPGDKVLYDRLREIITYKASQRTRALREEIHRRNFGENAINRIVKQFPHANPMAIVTDDGAYSGFSAQVTSGQEMPVALASTLSYIDAEIKGREETLRRLMKESDPISLERFGKAYRQFKGEHVGRLIEFSRGGQYYPPTPGTKELRNIIKDAVVEAEKNDSKNDISWVERIGPAERTGPGNISLTQATHRPGDGSERIV